MNSNAIFSLIEQIAATSSKNDKLMMVKGGVQSEEFKRVLEYAYSPFLTYGVIPENLTGMSDGDAEFDADVWALLDDLAARNLTGNAAREAIDAAFARLSMESGELLWRIIKKDLRAGFSESTINKACKGLIPDFPYMRCCLPKDTKLSKFDWKTGVISQEKADGMFANINHEDSGVVTIMSRQGSQFPVVEFGALVAEVAGRLVPGFQYHGELLVRKSGKVLPREIGNGILNSVLKGGSFAEDETPVYMAWDMVPLDRIVTKGQYNLAYRARLVALITCVKTPYDGNSISVIPTRIVNSLDAAYAHYAELLEVGKEGTIIKDPHAIWKDGTSKEQVKLKLEVDVDLRIKGFTPGEGKNASTFGSITCETDCGELEVNVSGFSDDLRAEIHRKRDEKIGKIMTVRANSIMFSKKEGQKHSLFLPRHVEIREDKNSADTFAQVKVQFENAVKPK